MQEGVIVLVEKQRGFGLIVDGRTGEDVYFHHSALGPHLFESLSEGQSVEFECQTDPRDGGRLRAVSVIIRY